MSSDSIDTSEAHARQLDAQEQHLLRDEFIIPSKGDLASRSVHKIENSNPEPSIYLCGNSLGLQPKRASEFVQKTLSTWATKGVYGHFKKLDDAIILPFTEMHEPCHEPLAKIVGGLPHEVAVMQTLTANLHLLMATFYQPTKQRHKIILEAKAFPSDHFAVESQILNHGFNPSESMILIQPPSSTSPYLPTSHIISVIQQHAAETALVLLPGIQFYSGQLLNIREITAATRAAGVPYVGWDLAHAVGNAPLNLHDDDVDFAAWCHYKYLNAGPGAIGGLFVHDKHSAAISNATSTDETNEEAQGGVAHLKGWWGTDPRTRFDMTNHFSAQRGAKAWQLSNPSTLDISALLASLAVFEQTSMPALRKRSLALTGYLEKLLDAAAATLEAEGIKDSWDIITPRREEERGAQLSVRLRSGSLEAVLKKLEEEGIVVDERKPNVIRVAPAPLYNTYWDAWKFVDVIKEACREIGKHPQE